MRILEQNTETVPLDTLRPHPRNPRQGDIGAIHTSIETNGFYGAIIAQRSTGHILAGNHRWQAARAAGAESIPVTWIDVDDEHALRILLADNRTNDLATYDDQALTDLLQELQDETGTLLGTGYDTDDLDDLLTDLAEHDTTGDAYNRKVISPIYEPSGPPPSLEELRDRTTVKKLQESINAADIPDDIRTFLLEAAERHTRFHFDRIANYYAHAPAQIQALIEENTLVIIDFNQALEHGFVKLNEETADQFTTDHPDA